MVPAQYFLRKNAVQERSFPVIPVIVIIYNA